MSDNSGGDSDWRENERTIWEHKFGDQNGDKPEKAEITDENKFFKVGPFNVYIKVDKYGTILHSTCDCESTSRVVERHLVYLFSLDEPVELDSEEMDLTYCVHEYAAIARIFSEIGRELEKEGIVALEE